MSTTVAKNHTEDVVIIGAGASGLSTADALRRLGICPLILERSRKVAASWRTRHPQLRLNTHRWLSGLRGMPVPRSAGAFASRDGIIDYLERYAEATSARICFGCEVAGIHRHGDHWQLKTSEGRIHARHVVIATGRERKPSVPEWPGLGQWRGELLHSADLGDVSRYEGKRVLVVGAGNSGTDVLNHLASVRTRSLHVSVRQGSYFVPTRLLGFPVHLGAVVMTLLPLAVTDRLLAVTERIAFGDLARYGLPRKRQGAASRLAREGVAPAIDNGFIRALKAGRVKVAGGVSRFDEDGVSLADGQRLNPDIVIAATGYRPGLESLLGHLDILDGAGLPRVGKTGESADVPTLWFAGMYPQLPGNFWVCRRSSGLMARAIRNRLRASAATGRAAAKANSRSSSPVTLAATD
ncbi:MAG: NAD(P)/FAD-dependent oxidoreductase [Anderseniella sp.]|jgi:cation diffusion facilitator CzcD-associated flavoprotein CzcO|nr:NAD(P)/FAD-dependent oxidoreductase [Anderseniella sp.]